MPDTFESADRLMLSSPPPTIEPARLDQPPLRGRRKLDVDPVSLPDIDLSIVTYKSERWFESYFASLAAQDYPLEKIHLFLIDHSPDETCLDAARNTVSRLLPGLAESIFIRQPNKGFGAGHNRTLKQGGSVYVLVTNVDLTYEADTLTRLVGIAMRAPGNVASWECRQKPYEHPKIYDILTRETPWSSSACVLFRREAWKAVGGYDEHFFMYGEDVDLSCRLRDAGWKLHYCAEAVAWHFTYESPNEVKETQYFGSTIANGWIRLRFGGIRTILSGIAMQIGLLLHHQPFPDRNAKLWRNYRKFIASAPYFLRTRTKDPRKFEFVDWDYSSRRDGAFHVFEKLPGKTPLASIIVRTYPGREPLLREALKSIALQTWPSIEAVVIEDGGDTMRHAVHELRETLGIDIVYYAAPKRGRSHTGNIGLALARGETIGFLDDDDLLFADHVEVLSVTLQGRPECAAAYSFAWEFETTYPETGWVPYRSGPPLRKLHQPFNRSLFATRNFIPIQAVLFQRSLYERHGGFYEPLENLEDWDLWQRYALDTDFACVEKTTSIYRTPADAEMRARRMDLLNRYYDQAAARQILMRRVYTVADLRGMEQPPSAAGVLERLARWRSLYLVGRFLMRTSPLMRRNIIRMVEMLQFRPLHLMMMLGVVAGLMMLTIIGLSIEVIRLW